MIPAALELINSSERYNRVGEQELCIMVIGVPNVGKSSLINALRNKHLGKGKLFFPLINLQKVQSVPVLPD